MVLTFKVYSQFEDISLEAEITEVQPMTGIVLWNDSGNNNTDAISLEFSYMLFDDIVNLNGAYHWDVTENKLNDIASRGHQAIFRFRYVYPGYETSVPLSIKNLPDYNETEGISEGKTTWFPDWTHPALEEFTLEFYTKFSEKYDNDPRLAFVQVGFGLWAEYHIYDGPNTIGVNFPSKEFQERFFYHLDTSFINIPWSISIDAADDYYTPFDAKPELKDIKFGVFDDSFMHENHSGYNTSNWNFFDRERYKSSPAGGEFSYYTSYDQEHMLDLPDGPYGKPYETFADNFHITYMIGNDQPRYQTMERIKEASMASGYKFKIVSIKSDSDTSVFEILNYGVAPIYYDAYISVNGVRSSESLKLLAPNETKTYSVSAGAKDADITIECDKLLEEQEIQYYGTQELPTGYIDGFKKTPGYLLYPNPVNMGDFINLSGNKNHEIIKYAIYDIQGKLEFSNRSTHETVIINTNNLNKGLYFINVEQNNKIETYKLVIL